MEYSRKDKSDFCEEKRNYPFDSLIKASLFGSLWIYTVNCSLLESKYRYSLENSSHSYLHSWRSFRFCKIRACGVCKSTDFHKTYIYIPKILLIIEFSFFHSISFEFISEIKFQILMELLWLALNSNTLDYHSKILKSTAKILKYKNHS